MAIIGCKLMGESRVAEPVQINYAQLERNELIRRLEAVDKLVSSYNEHTSGPEADLAALVLSKLHVRQVTAEYKRRPNKFNPDGRVRQ